jgi:hypothetical protein
VFRPGNFSDSVCEVGGDVEMLRVIECFPTDDTDAFPFSNSFISENFGKWFGAISWLGREAEVLEHRNSERQWGGIGHSHALISNVDGWNWLFTDYQHRFFETGIESGQI